MASPTRCPGRNGEPCGVILPARIGPGRPTRYCDRHKANGRRKAEPLDEAPDGVLSDEQPAPLISVPPPPVDVPQTYVGPDDKTVAWRPMLEPGYRARLEAMDRANSAEGLLVLSLCWTLDHEYHTGAARASLVKQLRDAWAEATAGAPIEPDALDEITRKRREKFGG